MVPELGSILKAPPTSGNEARAREKEGLGWSRV